MFQTRQYTKELINYLHTATVKNDIVAWHMFDTWVNDDYKELVEKHPRLHPYYRNITGDYILSDLSAVEALMGVDRSKMTMDEYRGAQRLVRAEALNKYGVSDRVELPEGVFLNRNIYNKFNELVTLNSMDTQEPIALTKKILYGYSHVKTIASYKIPNAGYYELCEAHPSSAAIIKAILYPVSKNVAMDNTGIREIMDLDNFTLLSSDVDLLEKGERESMMECMNDTLAYIRTRWGVSEFSYEDLYPAAHDAIVWNMLFLALHVQRIKNIRTYSVHSYHLWEYMRSHGFDNYEDVLTRKQALFLYKNLPYLLKHKGTEKVLELLSYVLLDAWNMRLDNKILVQNIKDDMAGRDIRNDTNPHPGFVSKRVGEKMFDRLRDMLTSKKDMPFQEILSELEKVAGRDDGDISDIDSVTAYETVEDVLKKEKESGLEYQGEISFLQSQNKQNKAFSITPHNILKTKLLELNSPSSSLVFETLYARFITQQILYLASVDHLRFAISILPSYSESFITLTAKEAVALLLYAIAKERGYSPSSPPKMASVPMAYRVDYGMHEMQGYVYIRNTSMDIMQILKPKMDAYVVYVSNFNQLNGMYVPSKNLGTWVNIDVVTDDKPYLKYNKRQRRWEYIRGLTVVAYSGRVTYKDPDVFTSNRVPFSFPSAWYSSDKRVKIFMSIIPNPNVKDRYEVANSLNIPSRIYTSVEEFSSNVHIQGEGFVSMMAEAGINDSNKQSAYIYGLRLLNKKPGKTGVCANRTVELNLLNGKTYKEFFRDNPILNEVISSMNLLENNSDDYAALADTILNTLYPVYDKLNMDSDYTVKYRYRKLKELFISMCSYNVAFLEAKNKSPLPYTMRTMTSDVVNVNITQTIRLDTSYRTNYKSKYNVKWNDMNAMRIMAYV